MSNEFGLERSYRFSDGTNEVVFGFNQDTSDCAVQVFAAARSKPLMSLVYLNSPGAKVVATLDGAYLEVGAPNSAPDCTNDWFVPSQGLRLHLRPIIFLESFGHA